MGKQDPPENKNNLQTNIMLPNTVYRMCVHGGLLAGSFAKYLAGDLSEDVHPNDYDILVPYNHWQKISLLIPKEATPNKFGGWSFADDHKNEIDCWPGDIFQYLSECKTKTRHGGKVWVVDFINNKGYASQSLNI